MTEFVEQLTNVRAQRLRSNKVLIDGQFRTAHVDVGTSGRVLEVEPVRDSENYLSHDVQIDDLGDRFIAPLPVDIHFHGARGVNVPPGATFKDLDAALAAAPPWQSTAPNTLPEQPYQYVATLPIPSRPPAALLDHVAAAVAGIDESVGCCGIRLEGVFINPQRAGVWPPETFHAPDLGLLDALIDAANGHLRIIDVAPELPGALALIERARERGVTVAIAHTQATYDQGLRAFDAGATIATHLFNAMPPVHHRAPGFVVAALNDPRVRCELICDGVHVHPAVLALAVRAAGSERIIAISDASPYAGAPLGEYEWAGTRVLNDGVSLRTADGTLAGSASLLPRARDVLVEARIGLLDTVLCLSGGRSAFRAQVDRPGIVAGDRLWIE